MNTIPAYNTTQSHREQTIMTDTQKKQVSGLRQGVLVDNMINGKASLKELYDSLLISENSKDTAPIYEKYAQKKPKRDTANNALLGLCISTIGLFGAITGITAGIKKLIQYKINNSYVKHLPEIPRNVNLNTDSHFITYAAIQNPNAKTIISALGVFTLASSILIAKNFIDGFREIWVKKQEAKIQRDLQEKLINVEARTFSGKISIIRAMMSEYAGFFENILQTDKQESKKQPAFSKFLKFNGSQEEKQEKEKDKHKYLIGGLAVITGAAMGALTFLSLKNLQNITKTIELHRSKSISDLQKMIKEKAKSSVDETWLNFIKKAMSVLTFKSGEFEPLLSELKKKTDHKTFEKFHTELLTEMEKISQVPPENFAGTPSPKPAYVSYIDDVRGHFYNWLVNFDSPFLAALFFGIAAVSAGSYIGTNTVEALKDVQVKKINAQTELNLQKQLIEVELKNFETKKRAAITPLIDEFRLKNTTGKNKEELKNMATNILYEIKNGPPYVYS